MLHFYTLTMNYHKEKLRKIIPLTISSERINLGINLTKEVKNLYLENYKILMKEIEDNTNR